MELSVIDASASILLYDKSNGQWTELGTESGICTLSILKSPSNEYRFVAWKNSNEEVVLNSFLFPCMYYNESTPNFHQWFDEQQAVYGLNFSDPVEAKKFSAAVASSLDVINSPKTVQLTNEKKKKTLTKKKSKEIISTVGKAMSINLNTNQQPMREIQLPTAKPNPINIQPTAIPAVPTISSTPNASASGPPPPTGPPPPGPPPPGPPPPGPASLVTSMASTPKTQPSSDLANQLKNASENMKKVTQNKEPNNFSDTLTSSTSPKAVTSSNGPVDFLSELKMKSKSRTLDSTPQIKRQESCQTSSPSPTISNKSTNEPRKFSSFSSPTSSSHITTADLEKFKTELMKNILSHMERIKNEIISDITAKLS